MEIASSITNQPSISLPILRSIQKSQFRKREQNRVYQSGILIGSSLVQSKESEANGDAFWASSCPVSEMPWIGPDVASDGRANLR